MATNLLIGYPDFFWNGSSFSSNSTAASGFEADHIISGERGKRYKQASDDTGVTFSIDLGSGNDNQPSWLYIARMDLILAHGTHNVRLEGGTSIGAWVESKTHFSVTESDLVGPNSEDYVWAPSGLPYSSDYQAWRLELWNTTTTNHAFEFSKAYFGSEEFDFGRDPTPPYSFTRTAKRQNSWNAPREFSLTWDGVSNDKLEEFIDKIYQYKDINPIFLHDQNDYLFGGDRLLHVKINYGEFEAMPGKINRVRLDLMELTG